MSNGFPLRTAFRIAWRESRSSFARFLFVVIAVAVGVGSLYGVRGFSRSFRATLLKEARVLMAADVSVRIFELPTPGQLDLFTEYERRGVVRTQITETISMMSSSKVTEPLLVGIKAVDPAHYPFYGEVKLDPPAPLSAALTPDSIALSPDLMLRLNVSHGETIRLGGRDFRVSGALVYEPDRITGSMNIGPRSLLSREGLDRTGLIQPGSRAAQRHIFRLPAAGVPVEEFRAALKSQFPRAVIADFRETHPLVTRGLDRSSTFLSLVSLIALVVGAIGVATAMQSHLQQKLDSIAVMKSLGGRSGQIMRIYLIQTLMLAAIGAALGVALGFAVQFSFPWFLERYYPIRAAIQWSWTTLLEGFGVAVLTTLLFTLPTLLGIREIKPGLLLRREMEETKNAQRRNWRAPLLAAIPILCGIAGIAIWLVGRPWDTAFRVAGWFTGGLVVSMAVLSAVSWVLLRGLKLLIRARFWRLPATLRHGIANLYRPGSHAQAILVALGVGVMFTLTVWLVQHSVVEQLVASAPPGMPNVFLINITDRDRTAVLDFLRQARGMTGEPEIIASVAGQLVTVDGQPIDRLTQDGPARRFRRTRSITWADELPSYLEIQRGQWWSRPDPAKPSLAVSEDAAHLLALKPGSNVQFSVAGRNINVPVAAIFKPASMRPGASIEFIMSPGALDGLPMLYFGGVRVRQQDVARLQKDAFERFPAVTVINVADVLERLQEVVDHVANIVRFLAAFSVMAGAVILASSVAGTRFRRLREVVILKTLGATRSKVVGIFSVEFLVLGLVAGLMGSLLAAVFANLLLSRLFDAPYVFSPLPVAAAVASTALIANAAGWLASYRILPQKPLEILRQE